MVKHAQTKAGRRLHAALARDSATGDGREKPPLALWLHAGAAGARLPRATVRQLIAHYTEPGDLVLTGTCEHAAEAQRLNRRARPTRSAPVDANVRELPLQPAQLALVHDTANAGAAAALLAAGGFLALDLTPATATPAPLGAIVRELHQDGLQYWQHIVVADAHQIEANSRSRRHGPAVALDRVHRDLLVFRRPVCATAAAAAGSIWSNVVAA